MDDDVVFFAMLQRYNIYFKYVSLHHDILGSHGTKSSTENIYWANIIGINPFMYNLQILNFRGYG